MTILPGGRAEHGSALDPAVHGPQLPASFRTANASRSRRVLIKDATIVSMDPAIEDLERADILVEGTKIAAVGRGLLADAPTIDARGMIAIPGFCDPHLHAWQGQLGRLIPNQDQTGSDPLRNYGEVIHRRFAPAYRPEDVYVGTLVSLLSALDGGITTVVDNSHNARSEDHTDAAIEALFESGVRGRYAGGGPVSGDWGEQWPRDARRVQERYFSSADQLTSMGLYLIGMWPADRFRETLELRRELGVRVHIDSGLGGQPLQEYYDSGLFYGDETFNHGTGLTPQQRRIVVDGGMTVNVCPRIETQFRSGHVPYREWVEVGHRPGISNDDPVTYPVSMFDEMRTLYSFERGRQWRSEPPTAPEAMLTVRDVLDSATLRGAENCGLSDRVGSLTPGKEADIVLMSTAAMGLQPVANAVATVVQGGSTGAVDTVLIAGRLVKWRGRLVGVDLARIRREVDASLDHLFAATRWPLDRVDFAD